MQTNFTEAQLADPDIRRSNEILRTCVHCGFCTATCPTYTLLGDELDSPRGRIYLIKQMLEEGRPADRQTVKHLDRCLSCLACMTTCPSGVHYMHLIDHARAHVEATYKRPFHDRALRSLLAWLLPKDNMFRLALLGAKIGKPLAPYMPDGRLKAMLALAPKTIHPPSAHDEPQVFPAQGERRMRVALMTGCAQKVLDPEINAATIRLLTRHGAEVVIASGAGCCGALTHHMGKSDEAHGSAAANIAAWSSEMRGEGLDAVVINASGCGTTVKDYGHMFRTDPALAEDAAAVSAIARDITEVMAELGMGETGTTPPLRVAYHAACSLQHGQKVTVEPKSLLKQAGFTVLEPKEGHLCCGSAGTYNLLQPKLAGELRTRKIANLERTRPEVIASGNIGCLTQIGSGTGVPVVHTAQLLDWATGGPVPAQLEEFARPAVAAEQARGRGMDVVGLPLATLLTFAATCLVIELTPGPNMAYLAILSLGEGRRAGLAAVAGVALGLLLVGIAASLGLAAAISNSPLLYALLRWGGVLYLLYLAWEGWQEEEREAVEREAGSGRYFMRGLITNLLNPKAGVFYVAVLPGFVMPEAPVIPQTIGLSVVFVLVATAIHTTIVLLADRARRLLSDPKLMRRVRRLLSILLALIAVWFAWKTRT